MVWFQRACLSRRKTINLHQVDLPELLGHLDAIRSQPELVVCAGDDAMVDCGDMNAIWITFASSSSCFKITARTYGSMELHRSRHMPACRAQPGAAKCLHIF